MPEPSDSPAPVPPPPIRRGAEHERFDTAELAEVLPYFEIGEVERMVAYRRGSRRSPKLRLRTADGQFLLKRRAPGRDDEARVVFAHQLQLHLARQGYPVARLVAVRDTDNTILRHRGRVYELFAYIDGRREDGSLGPASEAGRALGVFHRLSASFEPMTVPAIGTFHAAGALDAALESVPEAISRVDPHAAIADVERTCRDLAEAYAIAAERVMRYGWADWPGIASHGDWHPGNLLYRDGSIVAVLDFDAARVEPRVSDIANGCLQFAMDMADGADPLQWPEGLELDRLDCFLRGYDQAARDPMTKDERAALPWLMIEALIAETVMPIAAAGKFANLHGADFLRMVRAKAGWLRERADELGRHTEA